MNNQRIYLDYAATTPVDERVLQSMLPYFREEFGNPSSIHRGGQVAEAILDESREMVANVLNCKFEEVIFTSCGSESDNLALRGVAFAMRRKRNANHILISPVEHHAVLHTAQQLSELHSFELEFLPVDQYGRVDPEKVAQRIRPDTALVSIIYANNEIGSINPISEIGSICRKFCVPFHTDAVQAASYLTLDVEELQVDLLSIGAHKFYGPKGIGALYIRKETPILPIQTGGSQEFGLRAGTHNIPYIVGLANALKWAQTERIAHGELLTPMRDHIIGQILEEITNSHLTGHPHIRLPNHISFVFPNIDGNNLLRMLDMAGFACSSGSACKTGNPEPSEVLTACGLSPELALGSLRVTLGKYTTAEEIDSFLLNLPYILQKAQVLSLNI